MYQRGLLLCVLPALLSAQAAPKDLCSLQGRVVDAVRGGGIRSAPIDLRPLGPAPAAAAQSVSVSADHDGKFALPGIPAFLKPVESKGPDVTVDPGGHPQWQLKRIIMEK